MENNEKTISFLPAAIAVCIGKRLRSQWLDKMVMTMAAAVAWPWSLWQFSTIIEAEWKI